MQHNLVFDPQLSEKLDGSNKDDPLEIILNAEQKAEAAWEVDYNTDLSRTIYIIYHTQKQLKELIP